jgi:hypothetical protein
MSERDPLRTCPGITPTDVASVGEWLVRKRDAHLTRV